jgi:DNA-binding MarR family transcriptional regulator
VASDSSGRDPTRDEVIVAVRSFILSAESFRIAVADYFGVGVRETEAVSYLRSYGSMTATDLGDALHLTTSAVSNMLDRLERSDLATCAVHPSDRRVTIVTLTERAAQLTNTVWIWLDQCVDVLADNAAARDALTGLAGELRQRTAEISAITDLQRQRHRGH